MRNAMFSTSPVAFLTTLLFLSSSCQLVYAGLLFARQADESTTDDTTATVDCQTYSTIANLSTISANSTYRAAFLRSTPDGTDKAAKLLNVAQAQLPLLTIDVDLNEQCGNATTIALTGAADNFTNGIVAEFQILPPVGISQDGGPGLITLILVFSLGVFMCGVFMSL